MLGDYNRVNVTEGSFSPKSICDIKTCNSRAKFMIFNDDGSTSLSRLESCCCGKHLSIAVRRAWKDNVARKKIMDDRLNAKAKVQAKKLLGIK